VTTVDLPLILLAALVAAGSPMTAAYTRLRRWFDGVAAVFFAAASLKILTARLT